MATAIASRKVKEEGGLFRILVGVHFGKGPEGCQCEDCDKTIDIKGVPVRGTNHCYRARGPLDPPDYDGDLIQSDGIDLCFRFNSAGPGTRKFERVQEVQQQPSQPPAPFPLEKMTLAQLMSVAEEEEIDLKGASKKEEVLRLIKAATGR